LLPEKVATNVKQFVIKVAKCKQSSSFTSIQILNHFTNFQNTTEERDGKGSWPMSNFWKNIKVRQK
jgi:hypothetical protein